MLPLYLIALTSIIPHGASGNPVQLKGNNSIEALPSLQSRLDAAFESAVRNRQIPGIATVALNRDGTILYNGSWGTVDISDPSSAPITPSTKMPIASMTKAVTVTAALQLVEQGKLCVHNLIEDYLPNFADIKVLEGFDDKGEPILRAPRTKATVLQAMTHTSGLVYNFLDSEVNRWALWARNQSGPALPTPLIADPGSGWFYGEGIDIVGHIVEAISGQRLDDYLSKHIFMPLGMNNSGLVEAEIHSHTRSINGTITSSPPSALPSDPYGGGFLTSTLDDYAAFLLALVNWGTHPQTGVTILQPSTVKNYIFTDQIPHAVPGYGVPGFKPEGQEVGVWFTSQPELTPDMNLLPGMPKGWTAAFLTNKEDIDGGRRRGSGMWAGIYNLYYWVDIAAGKVGIIYTNLLPFLDSEILGLFRMLEQEVYAL